MGPKVSLSSLNEVEYNLEEVPKRKTLIALIVVVDAVDNRLDMVYITMANE